jgi:hypothetical protein
MVLDCGSGSGTGLGTTSGPPASGTSTGSNIKTPRANLKVQYIVAQEVMKGASPELLALVSKSAKF